MTVALPSQGGIFPAPTPAPRHDNKCPVPTIVLKLASPSLVSCPFLSHSFPVRSFCFLAFRRLSWSSTSFLQYCILFFRFLHFPFPSLLFVSCDEPCCRKEYRVWEVIAILKPTSWTSPKTPGGGRRRPDSPEAACGTDCGMWPVETKCSSNMKDQSRVPMVYLGLVGCSC